MNYGWEIAKITFYLLLIVGVIYLLSYPLKRKIGTNSKSKYMEIIDRLYYDTKNSFIMLKVEEKIILVARSEGKAEKIAEWEKSDLNIKTDNNLDDKTEQKFNFKNLLEKYIQKGNFKDDNHA